MTTWLAARLRRLWGTSALGTIWIAGVWAVAAALGLAATTELALRVRSEVLRMRDQSPRTLVVRDYEPFLYGYPNPYFVFGFPADANKRLTLGNDVVSLDRHGFRQPGPDAAGGRKLAFLLGGSVAFSLFASSNEATIASQLNQLQSEYFFVSAGAPGLNSTQELIRLAVEVAEFSPALVVTLNGWNDAILAAEAWWRERGLPAGTPDTLHALESELSPSAPWRDPAQWLFPELTRRAARVADRWRGPSLESETATDVPAAAIADSAARYWRNMRRMHQLAAAASTRFVAVFQPLAALHQRVRVADASDAHIVAFHQEALRGADREIEFHDLGGLFDRHFAEVRVDEADFVSAVFSDRGHLHDIGNRLLAQSLVDRLGLSPQR